MRRQNIMTSEDGPLHCMWLRLTPTRSAVPSGKAGEVDRGGFYNTDNAWSRAIKKHCPAGGLFWARAFRWSGISRRWAKTHPASTRRMFTQCWFRAGPLSAMLAQQWNLTERLVFAGMKPLTQKTVWCWATICDAGPAWNQHCAFCVQRRSTSGGFMLRHRLRRWPNTKPALGEHLGLSCSMAPRQDAAINRLDDLAGWRWGCQRGIILVFI